MKRQKVEEGYLNGNVKAFLAMIRKAEGANYNTLFGGKTFSDFSKHPNIKVPFRNTYSTAAGAYQFLYSTWTRIATILGLKDFSERSQDLGAIYLIYEKNALEDVIAGRFDQAVYKIRKIWASLPGAGYNQPEHSLATVTNYYIQAGGQLA